MAVNHRSFGKLFLLGSHSVVGSGLVLATEKFWSLRLKPPLAEISELLLLTKKLSVEVIPPVDIDVSMTSGPDVFQLFVPWKLYFLLQLLNHLLDTIWSIKKSSIRCATQSCLHNVLAISGKIRAS